MSDRVARARRSLIFAPGLPPGMRPKALASGADIVRVELDDDIAPEDKAEARGNALALFEEPRADDGAERIARINSVRERLGIEDVNAVLAAGLDATDAPFLDLDDPAGMRADAEKTRDLAPAGRGSVHPGQVAALHEVFAPAGAQVALAGQSRNSRGRHRPSRHRRQADRETGPARDAPRRRDRGSRGGMR